jgi:hypothetical protein
MEGGIDDDEEEELEYGYRDTRNRTSHQHRVSSSLTPAQIMEQENNMYDHLTIAHDIGMYGLQLLILINERCRHLLFIISEYSSVGGAVVARYIESIQAHIQHSPRYWLELLHEWRSFFVIVPIYILLCWKEVHRRRLPLSHPLTFTMP